MEWPRQGGLYLANVFVYLALAIPFALYTRRKSLIPRPDPLLLPQPHDEPSSKQRQNDAYKKLGSVLLFLGLGGFVPSVVLLCKHKMLYSVAESAPHHNVNGWLVAHVVGAIAWAVVLPLQLASGGNPGWIRWHRVLGWVGYLCLTGCVAFSGGLVWSAMVSFFRWNGNEIDIGAGLYTWILSFASWGNMTAAIWYAKQRHMAAHKDHAMMAVMWSLDPGVHRTFMWIMHATCTGCYPDIPLQQPAKLWANLVLVSWTVLTAVYAGRLNRVLLYNAAGQWALWVLNATSLFADQFSLVWALLVVAICVPVGAASVYYVNNTLRESGRTEGKPSDESTTEANALNECDNDNGKCDAG